MNKISQRYKRIPYSPRSNMGEDLWKLIDQQFTIELIRMLVKGETTMLWNMYSDSKLIVELHTSLNNTKSINIMLIKQTA